MRNILLFLSYFFLQIHLNHGFLNFFSSKTTADNQEVEVVDPNHIRGLPEYLREPYNADVFFCDNNQLQLSKSSINDGYCDCKDKSDEPGTSACSGGTFHCINKGYKLLKIPSSRVDDSICDCCDGSDEGLLVKCPNTCKQVAEKEKSQLESMSLYFKKGYQIRQQLIKSTVDSFHNKITAFEAVAHDIGQTERAIEEIQTQINLKEEIIVKNRNILETNFKNDLFSTFELKSNNPKFVMEFLSNLILSLDLTSSDISQFSNTKYVAENHESKDHHSLHEDEDGYEAEDLEDPLASSILNPPSSESCELTQITSNDNLKPLCSSSVEELSSTIFSIIKKYEAISQLILISGFNLINHSLNGSSDFAKSWVSQANDCPSDFNSLKGHCELKTKFSNLLATLKAFEQQLTSDPEIVKLRSEIEVKKSHIQSFDRLKQEANQAREDKQKYQNKYEFLALKNQCFEVVDGKFSYTLCMLQNVKQKEVDGHSTVTLGEFSSIEESDDFGHSFKMHFSNGQYCHAFGARKADVTVVCGENNVLRSAAEPSTCFYTLTLESPLACTEKYAATNGITL